MSSALAGKHVVLGVSGGVAAYKAVELCRLLMKAGANVSPVLTDNAQRFIGKATFDALASEPALTSLWSASDPSPHTTLAKTADAVVVAPATARVIASLAHGLSDDVLATTLLATRAPVVVCPAMHTEMWEHPAVRANVAALRAMGVRVVDPEDGELAGGDSGAGRLAALDVILEAVGQTIVTSNALTGKTVVVTAGGTREPIDPVRFIGNRSSGKQGHALAEEALALGARVVLITASAMPAPVAAAVVRVGTAAEMHAAVEQHLPEADAFVMAAAVADFRPARVHDEKIKKATGVPEIELEPTVDILTTAASKRRPGQVIVGFAAETAMHFDRAKEKLSAKGLDLLVANNVAEPGAGFEHDTNSAILYEAGGGESATGLVDKRTVARTVVARVAELLSETSNERGAQK